MEGIICKVEVWDFHLQIFGSLNSLDNSLMITIEEEIILSMILHNQNSFCCFLYQIQ